MQVDGNPYRTIWPVANGLAVEVIDQTRLPHAFQILRLESMEAAARAIETMVVRGAPLIGATAAYGLALAMCEDPGDAALSGAYDRLFRTRPTAVNLRWALDDLRQRLHPLPQKGRAEAAWRYAAEICDEDVEVCRRIGEAGLALFQEAYVRKSDQGP